MVPNTQSYAFANRYRFSVRELKSLHRVTDGKLPEAFTAQGSKDVDPQVPGKACS
ncbi:hypothetical protein AbraIFM66950_011518 [Aspergillus brasiliensis]|nr:hypothetical protein AbraIFM66950_011518 [Aspergillus brasiliensis]